ncbi:MAG TPA: hypothetical protein VF066_00805 [Thermoleophilaceae bacterium]
MDDRNGLARTGIRLGLGALACGLVAVVALFFGLGGPLEPLAVLLGFTTLVVALVGIGVSAVGARAEPRRGALGIVIGVAAIFVPYALLSVLAFLVILGLGAGE